MGHVAQRALLFIPCSTLEEAVRGCHTLHTPAFAQTARGRRKPGRRVEWIVVVAAVRRSLTRTRTSSDYSFTVTTVSVTGGGSVYFYGDTMVAGPDAVCLLGQEARQANVTPSLATCSAPPSTPGFARLRLAFNGFDAEDDAFVDVLYRGARQRVMHGPTVRMPVHLQAGDPATCLTWCVVGPEPMTIHSVTPGVVAAQGGAMLWLSGTSFGESTTCAFEGDVRRAAKVTAFVSSALVLCEAPALPAGAASVRARASELELTATAAAVDVYPAAESRAVQPTQAVVTGGAKVKVLGHNFVSMDEDARCRFGTISVAASVAGARQVVCTAPSHAPDTISLWWQLGALYDTGGVALTYVAMPTVDAVIPQPSRQGGIQLTLHGDALSSSLAAPVCEWGGDDVRALPTGLGSKLLRCSLSLAPSAGFMPLLLSDASLQDSVLAGMLSAPAFPRTLEASPAAGWSTGGAVVTLTGQSLLTGSDSAPWCAVSDTFGVAVPISSALVQCEAPPLLPGFVAMHAGGAWVTDVVIGGGSAFLALQEPHMRVFAPVLGSLAGGTVVSWTGDGLAGLGTPLCRFGTVTVTASEAEAGLACSSPALLPSLVPLALGVNGQQWVKPTPGAPMFASVQLPTVLAVLPSEGSIHGDALPDTLTVVTDAASAGGTLAQLACVFGAASSSGAAPRTSLGPSFWSCALPPGPLGFTSVQLQLGSASSDKAPGVGLFAYTAPPSPSFLWPRRVGSAGGTLLHVSGYTFQGAAACVCVGDGVGSEAGVSPTHLVSSALVLCESPALHYFADGSAVALGLKQGDVSAGSTAEGSIPIGVAPPVVITDVSPSHIAPDGRGAPVLLSGIGIRESGSDGASCWMGTVGPIAALDVTSTTLMCVPVAHAPGPLPVGASPLGEPAPWGRFPVRVTVMSTSFNGDGSVTLSPDVVSASGGSMVRLTPKLDFFPDIELFMMFGHPSAQLLLDARVLHGGQVVLPATGPGFAPVWLSDGVSVLASLGQVTVLRPPHVYSIQPVTGIDAGGTHVYFTGAHFWSPDASWAALFDELLMTGGACASNAVCVAEAPLVSADLTWVGSDDNSRVVAAEVTNTPAAVRTADGVEFTYAPLPHVATLSPNVGDEAGGARVKLLGGPLRESSSLMCRFGTLAVRPAAVQSAAEMSCITPAMASSTASVVVSNNDIDFSPLSDGAIFTFLTRATVTYILPQSGSSLAIYTADPVPVPAPQLQCVFDGMGHTPALLNPAAAASPTSAAAWCIAPAQGIGFASVELVSTGAPWTAALDPPQFEFVPEPEALVAMPNAATYLGGTVIMITGRDFGVGVGSTGATLGPLVRFGDARQRATPARVVSSVLITVETPATSAPDAAPLAAGRMDGVFAPGAHVAPFAYVHDTRLLSANPPGGSVRGGTVVMLAGHGFSSGDAQFCRFGTVGPLRADFVSEVLLRCISPAHVGGPPVALAVARANALDLAIGDGVIFEY